ncbi:hypothetical protein [Sphingomonas lycopersici]|nr:hypothetical protein [Sphingomonas lycopersici]
MMRAWFCLIPLLAAAPPAWANDVEAPYYGPMKRWHGIGTKFGYADRVEKDGSWRIQVSIHRHGDPVDMAMYRAAERARDEGFRYIFFLGVNKSRIPGDRSATLYARPSHDAVAPTGCRSKKATTCYTADVAAVLRMLGGPGGTQPGVAVADHRDAFGREVFLGYGVGMVASPGQNAIVQERVRDGAVVITRPSAGPRTNSSALPAAAPIAPLPMPPPAASVIAAQARSANGSHRVPGKSAAEEYDELLKASQPLRGGDPKLGWKISD